MAFIVLCLYNAAFIVLCLYNAAFIVLCLYNAAFIVLCLYNAAFIVLCLYNAAFIVLCISADSGSLPDGFAIFRVISGVRIPGIKSLSRAQSHKGGDVPTSGVGTSDVPTSEDQWGRK